MRKQAHSSERGSARPPNADKHLVLEQSRKFLDEHRHRWRDHNVPYQDGRELERLVVEHGCTRVLEIGTSTGHATLWLARGVAQTGGRVTTLEVDPGRHRQALWEFRGRGRLPPD